MLFDLSPLLVFSPSLIPGIAILIALSFGIGIISSLFGVGGGFFFTPFFSAVLNLPATQAVATSMTSIPFQSASATGHYIRHSVILYREALIILLFSLFSSQFAAGLLSAAHHTHWGQEAVYKTLTRLDIALAVVYTWMIGGLGIYGILQGLRHQPAIAPSSKVLTGRQKLLRASILGLAYGALSSLLGIGGGFLTVPYFMYFRKTTAVQAVATSLFLLFITTFFAALQYVVQGQSYLGLAMLTAIGTIPGAQLGARLSFHTNPQKIKMCLGCFQLAVLAAYLYLKFLR